MGYMKWIKGIIDNSLSEELEYQLIQAKNNNSSYVLFDNTYMTIEFTENVINYIKKVKDDEEWYLSHNQESGSVQ